MRSLLYILALVAAPILVSAQGSLQQTVDSLYDGMTLEEKIGQLFMIRAHSNLGPDHVASVKAQIAKYHVGGMCFFQGTPQGHAELINEYQGLSNLPIMMAIDAEWGGGMRFKETAMSFPRQLMLGAVQDNSLIYEMGVEVGKQLKEIGLQVNFAPVVDVNNNPLNPVIGDRSFGEDMYNVTAKSYQYMRGMQDAGIIACAKHFPGHGDTDVDSHEDLPVIGHTRERLDSLELYPFKTLIDKGVESVMVAHLSVPALDSTPNLPTTLSEPVVTGLLRDEMQFDGLIFTDALEMKGVTKHHGPGEVEVLAIKAGNDVLCLPENINEAFAAVLAAVQSGDITPDRLESSVKRILHAKLALDMFDLREADLHADMFPVAGLAIKEELIENALTAVANDDNVIPVRSTENKEAASLILGSGSTTQFQRRLESYMEVQHLAMPYGNVASRKAALIDLLAEKDMVVVGLVGMGRSVRNNFGIPDDALDLLQDLSAKTQVIVVVFGSPYSLRLLEGLPCLMMAYQDDPMTQDIAAQALFGAISVKGRLPVTASAKYRLHHGLMLPSLGRLGFSSPERMQMSTDTLDKIAGVVEEMISEKAAPGCQILVAKEGKIIYQQSFGHFTYDRKRPVSNNDLYDVASVTKIAATTLAAMKLHSEGKFYTRQTLDFYLDDVRETNKEHLVIRDVMAHQAGLQPWIPFHAETVDKVGSQEKPSPKYYRHTPQDSFHIQVANGLYLRDTHVDSIWQRIIDSKLRSNRRYRYSDIGFYIVAEIIKRQTATTLDSYCSANFYEPLGMSRTCYKPLDKFESKNIAPTEEDKSFRAQRLQGFVHDAGSALMGGVGGHAGVFSTSGDLAILMQMLLNDGTYGGTRYIDRETVRLFTTRVPNSKRRGLGFDMKNLEHDADLHTSELASDRTFGHTGFTGTCVWADPEHELIYVFLSNRTYPSSRNNKLSKLEIRERIHTLIYESINS